MKKVFKNIWKNKGCYFFTFLTFFISFYFVYSGIGYSFFICLQVIFVGCLPFFLFLTFSILKNKKNVQAGREIISIAILLCGIFLPFYYPFAYFHNAVLEANNAIINPNYYKCKVHSDYLLEAFPEEIPKQAENVLLTIQPGFLQGGSLVNLYYKDIQLDIENFHMRYKDKALWSGYRFQKNDYIDLSNTLSDIPSSDKSSFFIYLLDGYCDNSGYCNHGRYLIAAINENTKEVVYKFSQW